LTIEKNTEILERTIWVFDFSGTVSRFTVLDSVSPDNLSTPDTNKTEVVIQINSFFNVNENFSRNHHKITMEVA
jgi:hypothetical protein